MNILQLMDHNCFSFLWGSLPEEHDLLHVWTFEHRRHWGAFREGLGEALFGQTVFIVPHSGWRQDEKGAPHEAHMNEEHENEKDPFQLFLLGPEYTIPELFSFASEQEKQHFEQGVEWGRRLKGMAELDSRLFFKIESLEPINQNTQEIGVADQAENEFWHSGSLVLVGWSSPGKENPTP